MEIVNLLWILGALFALFILWNVAWDLYDRIHPVRYGDLAFPELRDHFNQFLRRGNPYAEMVLESPVGHTLLCLRKWFLCVKPELGTDFYVVFVTAKVGDPRAEQFRLDLLAQGRTCGFGLAKPKKYQSVLACTCRTLDEVMAVTEFAVQQFLSIPPGCRFSVYVKGWMELADIIVDAEINKKATIRKRIFGLPPGRPYKRWQLPGFMDRLGRFAGALCRRCGLR